ncbi:hypothetical protein OMO38_19780 [Chryseobacterium sp. 09-1422]|jgi:hypothetical protein|uniref:YcxB-like protein domain-containing protein n=1 Tax=Chryseobacterium kimseyorum TaxID=2984028 RepID=A0ABT3I3X9_9FLAO|nr:hypothetical protein [Chryseobacterium kimseyorum]MCW3170776.1 hypothetical protein [Chryseobacterium kimseyorum]
MIENRDFIFKNVLPYHVAKTLLVIIPCMIFYGALYYLLFKGMFRLSFVMFFTLFYFGTCYLILKAFSVQVKIWFDDKYLFIQKGKQPTEKYFKSDIKGFYAYDYESKAPLLQNSKIYFKFCLMNNSKIYLNDVEYKNKYEIEKGENLKKFLKYAQNELHFTKIKKKNFQNIYWYSDRN